MNIQQFDATLAICLVKQEEFHPILSTIQITDLKASNAPDAKPVDRGTPC